MSTSKRTWVPSICKPCTPARSASASAGCVVSAVIDVRVSWRSSLQRPGLLRTAGADDAHPVAQRFDLGEDVARQQHGAAFGLDLADAVLEDGFHQRVETGGRLVEDQQLGVRRERGDEADLLPVALRVRAGLLRRVELEALEQLVAPARVEVAAQPAEQVDHLAAAELRPQADLAGDVREPAVQRHRVAPRIAAEELDAPGVGAQQPEQHADRRGLAGAVRSEESVDLAASRRRGRGRRAPGSSRTS